MKKEKQQYLKLKGFEYLKETIKALQMVAAPDVKELFVYNIGLCRPIIFIRIRRNYTTFRITLVELNNTKFHSIYDYHDFFLPEPYYYNKKGFEPILRLLTSKEYSTNLFRGKNTNENWDWGDYWLWTDMEEVYYFLLHLAPVLKISKSEFGGFPDLTKTRVLVLSGPCGSGKSSLIESVVELVDEHNKRYSENESKSYNVIEYRNQSVEECKNKISELEEKGGDGSRYIYIVDSVVDFKMYYDKSEFSAFPYCGEKGDYVYFYHIVGTLEEKGLSKKEIEEGLPFLFFLLSNTTVEHSYDLEDLLCSVWECYCDHEDSMRLSEEERRKYYYNEYIEYENRVLKVKNK